MKSKFLAPEEREYFSDGISVRKRAVNNYREYEKEIEENGIDDYTENRGNQL